MSRRVGFAGADRSRAGVKQSRWAAHLIDNEEVLWEGKPGFGFQLNSSVLKTMGFVGLGFAFLGRQILDAGKAGSPMGDMLAVPYMGRINPEIFLSLVAAWMVIWFVYQTVSTPFFRRYMLSDSRAFIAKTFVFTRIKSYPITPIQAIEYIAGQKGSIIFASETRRADSGKKRTFPIGFMRVSDAKKVYKMMVEIQNRAKIADG